MKSVTRFEANDGVVFATPYEAEKRDALLSRCAAVEAILGPRPKLSGDAFHQHDLATMQRFHADLVALAIEHTGPIGGYDGNPESIHPRGIMGRYLDDSGATPLNRLWNRRMCIDSAGREYEQPYYAFQADRTP